MYSLKKLLWNRGQDNISEKFSELSDFSKSSAFTDKAVMSYDTFCDRYLSLICQKWHQVTDIWSWLCSKGQFELTSVTEFVTGMYYYKQCHKLL